jgi:hypothetical protein
MLSSSPQIGLAARIDKLGFRRWYERRLIEAHAYFVTCFLCIILVAVSMDGVQLLKAPTSHSIQMLLLMVGGLALGVYSFNRFRVGLNEAEHYAEHSACAHCQAYGVFKVIRSGTSAPLPGEPTGETWLDVRCKKCSHEWRLP